MTLLPPTLRELRAFLRAAPKATKRRFKSRVRAWEFAHLVATGGMLTPVGILAALLYSGGLSALLRALAGMFPVRALVWMAFFGVCRVKASERRRAVYEAARAHAIADLQAGGAPGLPVAVSTGAL